MAICIQEGHHECTLESTQAVSSQKSLAKTKVAAESAEGWEGGGGRLLPVQYLE